MQRLMPFLTARRTLCAIGVIALFALAFLAARLLERDVHGVGVALAAACGICLAWWAARNRRVRRAASRLGDVLLDRGTALDRSSDAACRAEIETLRNRMAEAIDTLRSSRIGQHSGSAALYALPWYLIIGNPAAGKSTAIANSGLRFPLAEQHGKILRGIGGTRNCDWFFTTDGIVLDTAGRYSVREEDRKEWFGFLALLRKYRPKAPINGIIIAVSIAELCNSRPELAIQLAKNLRQRVQELTERLEVCAPVYVMFTKADLIAGFTEFFVETDRAERDRAWGATLPYSMATTNRDALSFFDARFDELYAGLKEMSTASMAMRRGEQMLPGVLTFPLEFLAIKGALRTFIATLFEENPFQHKPVFRGFYFTSALQEGHSTAVCSERIVERFGLDARPLADPEVQSRHGFFLNNLFRKVIFADKGLVARFSNPSRTRARYAAFFAATTLLGLALGGWSWSYLANRQLVNNVQADFQKAVRLQENRIDLQSRFEALEILQDRLEQLDAYRRDRPLPLSFGLYQGEILERKLREEYFAGMRELMLKPVAAGIESFLSEMVEQNRRPAPETSTLHPAIRQNDSTAATRPTAGAGVPASQPRAFDEMSPAKAEDGYNTLKTYLMLMDRSRAEAGHLNDQLARFWRAWLEANRGTMPREQMMRNAEQLLSFHLAQIGDPSWPSIEGNLSLVDVSRDSLRRVVKGMAARDRVYAEIKARAAVRFPSMTVARLVGESDKTLIHGSHAVPGAFTRDAWEQYVRDAFQEAANHELRSADWVLKTAARDDLTLEGSPEQIQKALTAQYKTEYVREWMKFVQGITVMELGNFNQAVEAVNRLGDPFHSPLRKIVETVHRETSWDHPQWLHRLREPAQGGAIAWLRRTLLGHAPVTPLPVESAARSVLENVPAQGSVAGEFDGIARLVAIQDNQASLLRGYMELLSRLRTRLHHIANQGDVGPGVRQFMQQTLDGSGSELADALRFVDEQMLSGLSDAQRRTFRPLLVRPLMQSFAVLVKPTEAELNRTWQAQVVEPFQKTLAIKYPFSAEARIEANAAEIAQVFGPDGTVAKFVNGAMGPLVVRRGDVLTSKTWADMGIRLSPVLSGNFAFWVAPPTGGGAASASPGTGAGSGNQTLFQVQPLPAAGTVEITLEIDGQQMRYRNTQSQWTNFLWPNPQGVPGARISAVTYDGRNVEVVNFPGRFGLEKLINAAQRRRKEHGVFELTWVGNGISVSLDLKIVSSPEVTGPAATATPASRSFRGLTLPPTIAGDAALPPTSPTAMRAQGGVR